MRAGACCVLPKALSPRFDSAECTEAEFSASMSAYIVTIKKRQCMQFVFATYHLIDLGKITTIFIGCMFPFIKIDIVIVPTQGMLLI